MAKPDELLFFYSKAMMAALSTQKDDVRVLSVGLGGGTMPRAIMSYFKSPHVTTVELDSKMLEAAEEFMHFKQADNNRVVIQDARYFIRKQGFAKEKYDVILLDAFNGEYIPEHLTTREFLEEVKKILSPNGLLLSNTFSFRDFYNSESVTYEAVFPDFCAFKSAGARTVVAFNGSKCDAEKLKQDVERNLVALAPYIRNARGIVNSITDKKDWNVSAKVFTDEFSPANLYNVQ
ncbi:spermidine synthase [Marinagarivorans cellulosilyticus]|uniref:spermidine synthase n=1 Tax=Marinagarivorans cellulosilyticus TaxID=2721545 RepID=UPI001F1DFC27|nr:fused MFS/spermidine synthase [Marinagarivorans cellulosilyticus]